MQALEEVGELDNTYVFFTSDNGYKVGWQPCCQPGHSGAGRPQGGRQTQLVHACLGRLSCCRMHLTFSPSCLQLGHHRLVSSVED